MPWLPFGLAVVLWAGAAAPGPPLLVSAAVSLSEAMTDCAAAFERATGRRVTLNFGASNALARQIVHGAPVDVFVSADELQMAFAERRKAIVPGTRRTIASNALAIVVNGAGAAPWRDPAPLAAPEVRRIAIGDPEAVPAGVYARAWLERAGLWRRVKGRVVPFATVRGALAAVAGGAIEVGIVYRTDVQVSPRVSRVYEVSGPAAPSILYPAALVRQARDPEGARLFLDFLDGAACRRLLDARGFLPPPAR